MVSLALTGCGDDPSDARTETQEVARGVLLDKPDGKPVAGVELELLVWPSAQSGAGELVAVDTDVTEADGSFDLDALAADLSPHAASNGQVGLEIRTAGSADGGMRTTVRLTRAKETGTTTVEPVAGLVVTMVEIAPKQ